MTIQERNVSTSSLRPRLYRVNEQKGSLWIVDPFKIDQGDESMNHIRHFIALDWISPVIDRQYKPNKHFMKKSQLLSKEQKEDLLIEWNLYSTRQQEPILAEFKKLHKGDFTQEDFLHFLRGKLEIDGYWKKAGLA